jgi:GT2 family glycosyltransferase
VSERRSDIAAVPDVSIIVVSYNSEAYLERSVGAVAGGPYEVIVGRQRVDRLQCGSRAPALSVGAVTRARDESGFGAANNKGMRVATGR